jgi:hypothetical protein
MASNVPRFDIWECNLLELGEIIIWIVTFCPFIISICLSKERMLTKSDPHFNNLLR